MTTARESAELGDVLWDEGTDDLDAIPWNAPEPRVQLARPRRCRHPRTKVNE